jgi:2-keto-4-pentenoate hydratase/2-oxohepta-3-ene-1,7-dioic acid hydratase in catechol pathway
LDELFFKGQATNISFRRKMLCGQLVFNLASIPGSAVAINDPDTIPFVPERKLYKFSDDGAILKVQVTKLLAPIVPSQFLWISLNYRHHVKKSGAPIPDRPILFVKGNSTLQYPSDPISNPHSLRVERGRL